MPEFPPRSAHCRRSSQNGPSMRQTRKSQLALGEARIEAIKLNHKSRDDIPAVLLGLQHPSRRRKHCIPTCGCAASTVGCTAPRTGRSSMQGSTSMPCRARVDSLWPSASVRVPPPLPKRGASTRRSSRPSTTSSIAVSTGCAPTAPMGLHTRLPCRYWPRTCTASVCLCDSACVRPNDVEDAALPERGHRLAISPPARHTETGTDPDARKSGMHTGLTPSTLQQCRCSRFRGRNLAESVAVRRRSRAGVGVFWQTLD